MSDPPSKESRVKSRISMAILLTGLVPVLSCGAPHSHLLIDTNRVMPAEKEKKKNAEARPTYPGAGGEKFPYSTWLPESGKVSASSP